jgi:superfamily II DNA or RNA helicase
MLDALVELVEKKGSSCPLYPWLLFPATHSSVPPADLAVVCRRDLNSNQNDAVKASIRNPLTCIWGPPGTGKTHTIIAIIQELLNRFPERRVLVTAPTHNAVDNVLRKYVSQNNGESVKPVRVSTDVRLRRTQFCPG